MEQHTEPFVRPPFARDVIRVGVVGTGFGAMVHVPALSAMEGVEVTAICSNRKQHAHEVAARYRIPNIYDDYQELFADRQIDAVTLAVPPFLHHPMALAAMEAGLHLLVEKPLARTAAEARDLVRIAKDTGVCNMVAYHRRFEPARLRMKQLIDEGFIGNLHSVSVIVYRSTLSPSEKRYYSWLMEADKGGGVLTAIGSHYVDQLRWWFGEIHGVAGATSTAVPLRPVRGSEVVREVDADDNVAFVVRFASGALGTVSISYTAATDVGEEIVASGDQGILAIQEPDQLVGTQSGSQIRALLKHDTPLPVGDQRHIQPFTALANGWIEAIRTGSEASPSFEDGAKVQEVLDAVPRSQQLKRWIDLSGEKWPV